MHQDRHRSVHIIHSPQTDFVYPPFISLETTQNVSSNNKLVWNGKKNYIKTLPYMSNIGK